jgi:hypothetical protein
MKSFRKKALKRLLPVLVKLYKRLLDLAKSARKEISAEKESREGKGAGMSQDAARHAHVRK